MNGEKNYLCGDILQNGLFLYLMGLLSKGDLILNHYYRHHRCHVKYSAVAWTMLSDNTMMKDGIQMEV